MRPRAGRARRGAPSCRPLAPRVRPPRRALHRRPRRPPRGPPAVPPTRRRARTGRRRRFRSSRAGGGAREGPLAAPSAGRSARSGPGGRRSPSRSRDGSRARGHLIESAAWARTSRSTSRDPRGGSRPCSCSPTGEPVAAAVVCHAHPLHGGHDALQGGLPRGQGAPGAGAGRAALQLPRAWARSEGVHDHAGASRTTRARPSTRWSAASPAGRSCSAASPSGRPWPCSWGRGQPRVRALVALGLPLPDGARHGRSSRSSARPRLFVQGEHDEFGAGERIRALVEPLPEPEAARGDPGERSLLHRAPRRAAAGGRAAGPPSGPGRTHDDREGRTPPPRSCAPSAPRSCSIDLQERLLPAIAGRERIVREQPAAPAPGRHPGPARGAHHPVPQGPRRDGRGDARRGARGRAPRQGHLRLLLERGLPAAPERARGAATSSWWPEWRRHICVCQTVLGALEKSYQAHVVSDAVGSRTREQPRGGPRAAWSGRAPSSQRRDGDLRAPGPQRRPRLQADAAHGSRARAD